MIDSGEGRLLGKVGRPSLSKLTSPLRIDGCGVVTTSSRAARCTRTWRSRSSSTFDPCGQVTLAQCLPGLGASLRPGPACVRRGGVPHSQGRRQRPLHGFEGERRLTLAAGTLASIRCRRHRAGFSLDTAPEVAASPWPGVGQDDTGRKTPPHQLRGLMSANLQLVLNLISSARVLFPHAAVCPCFRRSSRFSDQQAYRSDSHRTTSAAT